MLLFFWIVFTVCVGILAANRGRNWFGWLLLSFVISPLISGILLLVLPRGDIKKCPQCSENVLKTAQVCKHCGHKFVLEVKQLPQNQKRWWQM